MLDKDTLRNQLITRRAFLLAAGGTSMLSLLASRMFYMQVIKAGDYKMLSDQNRINPLMIHPMRGDIYDRNGKLLVGSRVSYNIMLDVKESDDYKKSLKLLYKILDLSEKEQHSIIKKITKYGLKNPLAIMEDVPWQYLVKVEENLAAILGIYIETGQLRDYHYKESFAHVIGYSGILNEKEKKELGLNNIGNFNVGKNGIEKWYEQTLRGDFGVKKMEVNASGYYVRELSSQPSVKGESITLNINADLQSYIYNLLPKTGGSVVVMDAVNGSILSAVSSPSFDPNKFTGGISHDYWKELNNNPYTPLLNRLSQGTYPPGSIFKLVTILAALEDGVDPEMEVLCSGGASALGNNYYRCWHKSGHGSVNMKSAIEHSCNAYMYKIAKMIGGEKILNLAAKLGFGKITGIDLPGESSGFVPSASWKMRRFKSDWSLGDSLNIAIGQGALLATTVQIARFGAIIASRGKMLIPKIVGQEEAMQLDIKPEYFDILQSAMFNVVNSAGGTAYGKRVLDPNWLMCGKTGTSQVQAKRGGMDLNNASFVGRNHALFLGYAPAHNPKYAIVVVVDHGGGGGSTAAPIARDIVLELAKL